MFMEQSKDTLLAQYIYLQARKGDAFSVLLYMKGSEAAYLNTGKHLDWRFFAFWWPDYGRHECIETRRVFSRLLQHLQ